MRRGYFRGGRFLAVTLTGVLLSCTTAWAGVHDVLAFENVVASEEEVPVALTVGGVTGLPSLSAPTLPPTPGLPVDGSEFNQMRKLLVLRPITAAQPGLAPAVVLLEYLHGTTPDAADLTGVARLVRDYGVWAILPEAVDGKWNFGLSSLKVSDDVSFLSQMIDQVVARHPIDPKRIYMGGFSNGGLMVETYACAHPEKIAAAAVVGATIHASDQRACTPALGTPMLFINGTADPIGPYNGYQAAGGSASPSAPETVAFWAGLNGCAFPPLGSELPDTVSDGTTIHLDAYRSCTNGGPVEFYTVIGGGHTWPGTLSFVSSLGVTSQDINATTAIWNFFRPLSRP